MLRKGQLIQAIRYRGTNHNIRFCATIQEIRKEGVLIKDYRETVFMPWVCNLPNGGVIAPRKMYIEPCDWLYEENCIRDIISGNIQTEGYRLISGKKMPDGRGRGMWYQHGGWRTPASRYADNIQNFIKIGQFEIADYDHEGYKFQGVCK